MNTDEVRSLLGPYYAQVELVQLKIELSKLI